jgi:hypothetical protein
LSDFKNYKPRYSIPAGFFFSELGQREVSRASIAFSMIARFTLFRYNGLIAICLTALLLAPKSVANSLEYSLQAILHFGFCVSGQRLDSNANLRCPIRELWKKTA